MKRRVLLAFALAALLGLPVTHARAGRASRYPNELPGYQLHDGARWSDLQPLRSRMADVRRVLGPPDVAYDVSVFTKPYPGDATAVSPVWTYHDGDWDILVYFVRYCFFDVGAPLSGDGDLLCSIALIPRERRPFARKYIPPEFKVSDVDAPCASWVEYKDEHGLIYSVFTSTTAHGDEQLGDLNRIVYGPSDRELLEFRRRQ